MEYFEIFLLGILVVTGICTFFIRNLMASLIVYMAYSVVMSVVWALLKAPDLAITEAAVGAGVSSILLFLTVRKIRSIKESGESGENGGGDEKEK